VTAGRFVPPLAWTGVILWFGSGAWSAETTGIFALPLFHRLLPWASPELLDLTHLLARKLGHVVGYATLGALWWWTLRRWRAAVLLAAFTAFLDETHQATTLERGASAADVLLDSSAAGVGVALLAAGVAPTVAALTAVVLWWAALAGSLLIGLDLATGAPVGWLWLSTPAAWLLLVWRRRARA
jgi:VanZ family protein